MTSQDKGSSLKNGVEMKMTKPSLKWFQFETEIVWANVIGLLILHWLAFIGLKAAMISIYNLHFGTIIYSFLLYFLGGEGITMGAHRLWSHRTFKAKLPLEIVLLFLQTLAGQGRMYDWARDHRQHHKYTDTDADPHNFKRGFFFSHIGWVMLRKHPDITTKGRRIDLSDLEANPLIMFQKKYYYYLFIPTTILAVSIPVYAWNESLWNSFMCAFVLRTTLCLHATWNVNSFAHFMGNRPFDKDIMPSENVWVSLAAGGEGWHNYHHAFPYDYKAAELGTGTNVTRSVIEFCARRGWAYDLRTASERVVASKAARSGDGTYEQNDKHY